VAVEQLGAGHGPRRRRVEQHDVGVGADREGTLGEWSVATTSTSPASSAAHSAARSPASRSGGAHLAAAPSRSASSASSTR
jgi:hypothetical protein